MVGLRYAEPDLFGWSEKEKNRRVPLKHSVKDEVVRQQKGKCAGCTVNFYSDDVSIHIDHIKPVSKGGNNRPKNLQALCPNCHTKKHRKERVRDATKSKKKNQMDDFGFGMEIPKSQNVYRGLIGSSKPPKWL